MALINDHKIHCKQCGSVRFIKQETFSINDKAVPYEAGEINGGYIEDREFVYLCALCGQELKLSKDS